MRKLDIVIIICIIVWTLINAWIVTYCMHKKSKSMEVISSNIININDTLNQWELY
jgi:hypothetical protein